MKRKIFSKLLMVAILFASVSAFVSCKDYDDDINANKADIKAAQEQLATLTSNLTSLQQKLESEKAALLQELATTKSQLETQIADAKAQLNDAIAKKADQSTVDALITRVANLETDLAATKEAFNAKIEAINKSIESLEAIIARKADQTFVDQAIATLNAAISGKVSTEDFNAFKGEVAKIETNLSNLTTLVNTKADQAAVDAAIAAINKDIAQLQKDLEAALAQQKKEFDAAVDQLNKDIAAKADKSALDALTEKVNGLADAVANLQKAIETKADKATVEALDKKVDEKVAALQSQIDKLVTPEQLNAAVDKLNAAISLLESNLTSQINSKANKSDFAQLKEDVVALRHDFDTHGENIIKLIGDAIDDLDKKLQALIDQKVDQDEFDLTVAGIDADIQECRDSIASIFVTLAAVNGDIDDIRGTIAELAVNTGLALDGLDTRVSNNEIAIEALQIQADAVADFLADFMDEDGALKLTLNDLFENASEELKDSIEKQNEYRAAAIAKIGEDLATLRSELQDTIDSNAASIADLQDKFSKISEIIDERIAENINNLTVFVSKSLKSISLVPQLYIGGIEAIEFVSLQYTPMKGGTSGLGTAGKHNQYLDKPAVRVDDGTAEAYYRLNPHIVDRASLDEANIEFLAATAVTRAATVKSPVEFNGIETWNYGGQKGLIKVNLKKAADFTGDLNTPNAKNANEHYIVALKVPRKETTIAGKKVEAADIVSENSMLVEKVRTPRIARKPWKGAVNKEYLTWKDIFSGNTVRPNGYNIHHFTDSVTMWGQDVDAKQLVYAEVNWDKTFDVSKIVTACDIETPKDVAEYAGIDNPASGSYVAKHEQDHEITVDQLKKYGLEFRYAIPTKEYKMDVDHSTDQQKFATIDPVTGIVSSIVPQLDGTSTSNNRACVGKEPIIRIDLIDTKNGNIVDQRYLKIKWVEKVKKPVDLGDYETTTTLKPCSTNGKVGVTWLWFIDKAYANSLADMEEDYPDFKGLSQATFAAIYMNASKMPTVDAVTASIAKKNLLSPAADPAKPVVQQTTNENGDALIAVWQMEPQEIANIYPSQTKTFTAKITFHSILPTEWPDLTMNFKWTIKLPELPRIHGYYENYWFDPVAEHYILPVQYKTKQYDQIAAGDVVPGASYGLAAPVTGMQLYNKANNTTAPGTDYCVFYNNITNPFKFEQKNNIPQFIVEKLGVDCGTWDMQFTWTGKDAIDNAVSYTQFAGYRPASNTNSPALSKINWKGAGAYKLETNAGKQALQLEWWGQKQDFHETGIFDQTDGNHIAWDNVNSTWGGKLYNYAVLYADHHNAANQALLNPITPKGIGVEPEYSHSKGIQMGVWGTLNDWNIVPVKDYKFYMVEPLAINAELGGAFEEGYVSGTAVRSDDAFQMTDFRGYEVANVAPKAGAGEFVKYRQELYKYYEVEEPVWNLADVKYGLKVVDGVIKSDDNNKMTAAQISLMTNGNIRLSVTEKIDPATGIKWLVFKNNGGSNVEFNVKIYIPVTAKYGFGEAKKESVVMLYPKGKVPAGVKITPYPGNN
jgi:hypothetical protein